MLFIKQGFFAFTPTNNIKKTNIMNQYKRHYVTFEQATLLKEHEYNMDIKSNLYRTEDAFYKENESLIVNQNNKGGSISMFEGIYAAPEHWQVIEWLREKHALFISISCTYDLSEYFYIITGRPNHYYGGTFWPSPQEAASEAIDYILKEKKLWHTK